MNILKKDEKFFEKNMSHTKLAEYYKTKDNSLRIAIFENREFVAFETNKANNVFKETVLDKDERYKLTKRQQIVKKDGSIEIIQYFGTIKNI
jgi:hypothetical protein